ncbi:HD-GYP domain-containing protein [Anaerosporobacter sp.]|uniref:HD-GYP domain-containing protein n=1 Tax=Anaerosporobacter sp. TaxID=1872529 RepID=UPI00286F55CF|nr:HD-GYP domain-containing protein [Anaerosporobacter sp.]
MKIRVRTEKLKDGMMIADEVYSIIGSKIIPSNTRVSKKVIDLLNFHRVTVVTVLQEEQRQEEVVEELTQLEQVRASKEFKTFESDFNQVTSDLTGKINEIVYLDKEINVGELWDNLNVLINKTDNSNACFDLLRSMKHTSDFTYIHSVNVALISNMIAKWLRMDQTEIELLSVAGLLHDIGKTKLPQEIINKQELLNNSEIREFKRHSTLGYNILKEKDVDKRIQLVALTHHERCDGSGYPLRLKSTEICTFAKIVAIADTYDELTISHSERKAVSPFTVVQMFESEGLHQFDTSIMLTFLNSILDTYIHSDVLLSNGQKGKIVFINKAAPSRPIVKIGAQFLDLSVNMHLNIEQII